VEPKLRGGELNKYQDQNGRRLKMPRYLVKWKTDPQFTPQDPEERLKGWLMMCEWVKEEMKAGILKDFGCYSDGSGGYGLREEKNEEALWNNLLKYMPYLNMDAKPVITIDQTIEGFKKLAAAAQS
jgi:hypothetical protein